MRRVVVEGGAGAFRREHRLGRPARRTPVEVQAIGTELYGHQLDVVVACCRFEHGLVGVRVERLERRVHTQRLHITREAACGLEALGFRANLRERAALQSIELADRCVERVLLVEDGLHGLDQAVELPLKSGDTDCGPADTSGHRTNFGGAIHRTIVQVLIAAGNEVALWHERNLR